MLALLVSRLFTSRTAETFEKLRLLPLRKEAMRVRMRRNIENLFKRHDYLDKWEGLQKIKREAIAAEKVEHERLRAVLKKQRGTAIRLMTHFMVGKKRDILHSTIDRLRERGEIQQQRISNGFRKGIRTMTRIVGRRESNAFFQLKDSRAIVHQNKRLRTVVRILKEIRVQNIRWAFVLIRREMVRNRHKQVKEELKDLD
jgi:hypothetical protein